MVHVKPLSVCVMFVAFISACVLLSSVETLVLIPSALTSS